MANVDISIGSQRDRQPHRGRVTDCRQVLEQAEEGETPVVRQKVEVAFGAGGVEI